MKAPVKFFSLCFITILFFQCTKVENISSKKYTKVNLDEYAQSLMVDSSFIKYVRDFTISVYSLRDNVEYDKKSPRGFKITNVILFEKSRIDLVRSVTNFIVDNSLFSTLTLDERIEVINKIRICITSEEFRIRNPHVVTPLLNLNNELQDVLLANRNSIINLNSNLFSSNTLVEVNSITNREFLGCALGALMGAIGSYGDAFDDISYLITQGWSGAALFNAGLSIIKNASPWWKVASVVGGFAACLYSVAD